MTYTRNCSADTERLRELLDDAGAVVIGGGAGLSAAAGLTYSGERFERYFADLGRRYGFRDMYTGGFYPFKTSAEYWAYWSRMIYCNRYTDESNGTYELLFELVRDKDYFVITTNVDHMFQKSGFDKERLFYTQGDYGLFQCSVPCHEKTYDNEETVKRMVKEQRGMCVPDELIPKCPVCGREMTVNLRTDDKFVEDEGWRRAAERYSDFLRRHDGMKVLFLELGVGYNTPVIIKYPFWRMAMKNKNASYACINQGAAYAPGELQGRAVCINGDIRETLVKIINKKEEIIKNR